jgi:predicted small metal-binding protein
MKNAGEIYTVECPCGSIISDSEMSELVLQVQEHAKINHDMLLTAQDVEDMAHT